MKDYKTYIKEHLDEDDDLYEEEEDEPEMVIIGWWNYEEKWNDYGYIYILQKIIDEKNLMFYENYKMHLDSTDRWNVLSKEELKNHIYNNETQIAVYLKNKGWIGFLWKNLPKEIKDLL